MGHRPEEIARYTVEQNGGSYSTDVPDLLALFDRQQLTDTARHQVSDALRREGIGTDPDLSVIDRSQDVRLFVLQPATSWMPIQKPPASRASNALLRRIRPRTWKGWTAYGVAALVVLGLLTGDAEESTTESPGSQAASLQEPADRGQASPTRKARNAALRRQRVKLRQQRAAIRRERAEAAEARAVARQERERQRETRAAA